MRVTRRAWGWLGRCAAAFLLVAQCGCGDGGAKGETQSAPVLTVDASRDVARTTDYLRVIFLPANVAVTQLGGPNATRVFVAASAYFEPALALAEVADFLGVPEAPDRDLIGLRCQPDDAAALDVRLAGWPQVFDIVRTEFAGQYQCPAPPGAGPQNAAYCVALAYQDTPETVVSRALAAALERGAGLLEDPGTAALMRTRYGIYPGFSGLGLTVRGTADSPSLSAAETLEGAVSPEYLVRNVTLAQAGCRCIRVAPYSGRGMDPLDPRFIEQQGGIGTCRSVPKLHFGT